MTFCTHFKLNSCSLEKRVRSFLDRYITIYRRHENLLTKVTWATHEQYYRTLLETSIGTSKKIRSSINCILGKKYGSINNTIKPDGIHGVEPETIANAFNSYFNSIPITLNDNINNNLQHLKVTLTIKFQSKTIFIKHPIIR